MVLSSSHWSRVVTNLKHEGVGGVDEVASVPLGRALEAELAVGGHGVVEEGDAIAQLPVVEHLAVVLTQTLAGLSLELELVLVAGTEPVHGAHLGISS